MKKVTTTLTLLCATLLLSGCAGWETFQAGAAIQGARAADEALQTSTWGVCEAVTMGAWQRKFGQTPDKAAAWAILCGKSVVIPPPPPLY